LGHVASNSTTDMNYVCQKFKKGALEPNFKIQRVPFILSLSTVSLPYRKPAPALRSRESRRPQGHDKRDTLEYGFCLQGLGKITTLVEPSQDSGTYRL
jgi:hypothetical protein